MFLLSNFEVHPRTQSLTCCLFFMTDRQVPPLSTLIISYYRGGKKDEGTIIPPFHSPPFGFIKIGQQPEGPQLLLGSQTISLSLYFFFLAFSPPSFLFFEAGINRCLRLYVCLSLRCLVLSAEPRALRSPQSPHQESGTRGIKEKGDGKQLKQ